MKKLMILASLALFSACSTEEMADTPEANNGLKTITIPISSGEVDTRIAVDEANSSETSWEFVWEENDKVSVWHNSSCTYFSEFTIAEEGFDADMSTFTGEVATDATQIRVISPYDGSTTFTNDTYPIDISEQDGDLGKLYMMSDELIDVSDVSDGSVSDATPYMKHLGGFFALYFKITNAGSGVTYAITEVKLSGVPTTMDVDMKGSFDNNAYLSNMNSGGTITATLTGDDFEFANDTDMVEVRLNTLPFDFESGATLTIDITYTASDVEYTTQAVITNTSDAAIPFERAKFNYCTITIDPTKVIVSEATINGWGNGTEVDDTITVVPVEFAVTIEANGSDGVISATITPTDKTVEYYCGVIKSDDSGFIACTTDADRVSYILSKAPTVQYETGTNIVGFNKDIYDSYGLESGTDYIIFAYVVDDDNECLYYNSDVANSGVFNM
ncbi:MAG: hypothetical protein SNG02_04435 [Rikenellaceae bacterium]